MLQGSILIDLLTNDTSDVKIEGFGNGNKHGTGSELAPMYNGAIGPWEEKGNLGRIGRG